jgi:hypothetical protein
VTEVLQAIAMTVEMVLYAVMVMLICLLYVSVPVLVVYGAMYALSKLAGRIRAGHARGRRRSSPRP